MCHFLNSEFLKAPLSHCYQSPLITATFIGQLVYLMSNRISLHIITMESKSWNLWNYLFYWKHCFFTDFYMVFDPLNFFLTIYMFYKTNQTEPYSRNPLKKQEKQSLLHILHNCILLIWVINAIGIWCEVFDTHCLWKHLHNLYPWIEIY